MNEKVLKIGFFGGEDFSVTILEEMKKAGMTPCVVVTTPDKPKGRKMELTPTPVKIWAERNNIDVLTPQKLKDGFIEKIRKYDCDLFVVASYGKIIPDEIIGLPRYKTINIHPSLLPKLRGPAPIEYMILEDQKDTGVSIMLIDALMDHGPILAQEKYNVSEWPKRQTLENELAIIGAKLLINTIPKWVNGNISPIEQDHTKATYTKKIAKEDALIDLSDDPYKNFLKIQAYSGWPRAYFIKDDKRVIITDADFKDGNLKIKRVIPEGKKETDYSNII